jgi:uncharacterized membrane protein YfcA
MKKMWAQYKKTLIPTQIFIIGACVLGYYWGRLNVFQVIAAFVMMQLGSLLGAWWAARLKRQLSAEDEKLPLE